MSLILVRLTVSFATILCLLGVYSAGLEPPAGAEPHHNATPEASEIPAPSNNDMWSMVASMRDAAKPSAQIRQMKRAHFDWNTNLDPHGRYQLNWRVNYPKNSVTFALEINASKSNFSYGNDLFALGFSERGELASSDFCLVWFDLSHRIHLQDARTDRANVLELVDSPKSVCRLISAGRRAGPRQSADDDKNAPESDEGGESAESAGEADDLGELDRRELAAGSGRGGPGGDDDVVEILFRRPLEVCDEPRPGYYAIDNGTTHMVWFTMKGPLLALDQLNLTRLQEESAAGARKYVGGAGPNFEFGLRRAQLIATKAAAAAASEPPDSKEARTSVLDIRMDKLAVPAAETTYWCKLFKLPGRFESRQFHMTSYEAVIEPGNEHVVHHMELFNCAGHRHRDQLEHLYRTQGGWSGHCGASSRPPATDSCRRVILAWAMGAKPLVYPEQVGQAIGGAGYNPYVVLEVHYNNVARAGGLVDSSGLRFHYSAELRPFDAGVLEIGLEYTDKNSIPPNMLAPLAGYCVSECTRAAMSGGRPGPGEAARSQVAAGDEEDAAHNHHHQRHGQRRRRGPRAADTQGIYVFAAQMHTHLTGVASWTEHVRGGRLLGELQRDDHYSPHFQEIRLLPEPVHVQPGDALVHYCLYDTRGRANITLGGHATTDEMCVSYLHYYPRIDLEVCKSSVETGALERYFGRLASDELQGTKVGGREGVHADQADAERGSVSLNYHAINWSPRRARELIEFYSRAPLSAQCNRSDGSRWPGNWNGIEPTRLAKWPGRPDSSLAPDGDLDYSWRPGARELVAYRGAGRGRRHAQCAGRH